MRWVHFETENWHDTKPGWYLVSLNLNGSEKRAKEVIEWLYDSIDKPERHCRWFLTAIGMEIKFRYERDYILAALRWS